MVPSDNSANTDASANGPLARVVPALPDLNLEVIPNGPEPDQAQQLQPSALEEKLLFPIIQAQPGLDLSLEAIIQQDGPTQGDRMEDPMYFEPMAHAIASSSKEATAQPKGSADLVDHTNTEHIRRQEETLPDIDKNVSAGQQNITDIVAETGYNLVDPMNTTYAVSDHGQKDTVEQLTTIDAGEKEDSDMTAPQAFQTLYLLNRLILQEQNRCKARSQRQNKYSKISPHAT